MNELFEPVALAITQGSIGSPAAAWDLSSFLKNASTYAEGIFGLVIAGVGLISLGVGGVMLALKFWGSQKMQQSLGWAKIAGSILVGGAMMTGGWGLIASLGSGGQKTIEELGGGTVLLQLTSALF